ncbi:MAG: hypothetical protein FWD91_06150 [Treponema sp.]|nr:hypothetical protein [Treponema sp.]
MNNAFELLILVIIGIILIWLGRFLFVRLGIPKILLERKNSQRRAAQVARSKRQGGGKGESGEGQTCLVCSATLAGAERVSTVAFPSFNGGNDRFMHIRGCVHCLGGERDRLCPVCGRILKGDEILLCRLFERPFRRPHVHVLGCSVCKGPRSGRGG